MKFYTGVGSRETPKEICDLMTEIAKKLAKLGWILRTGGADGADAAFLAGSPDNQTENFLPWRGYGNRAGVVPNIKRNTEYLWGVPNLNTLLYRRELHLVKEKQGFLKLQARNVSQVLGLNLDTPSKFVILYAPKTLHGVKGGTNTALQVALHAGIPTFNLADYDDLERLKAFINK